MAELVIALPQVRTALTPDGFRQHLVVIEDTPQLSQARTVSNQLLHVSLRDTREQAILQGRQSLLEFKHGFQVTPASVVNQPQCQSARLLENGFKQSLR